MLGLVRALYSSGFGIVSDAGNTGTVLDNDCSLRHLGLWVAEATSGSHDPAGEPYRNVHVNITVKKHD